MLSYTFYAQVKYNDGIWILSDSVKQTETESVFCQTKNQIQPSSINMRAIISVKLSEIIFLLVLHPSGFCLSHTDLAKNNSPRTAMT